MIRLPALPLLVCMFCAKGLAEQDTPMLSPMVTTTTTSAGASTPTSCSCEEEIRHCDQLLAEKDENCAESRRESFEHCDKLLQASKEASAQATQENQVEMQKLLEIVSNIRGQKDTIQNECEKRVSDSYSRGWREAEGQYAEQLNANKEATQQARTAYQVELDRLTSVVHQIRQQKETVHTECEQRVTESYSLGSREAGATAKEQLDRIERQLSSFRLVAQVRNDHLIAEKERLEKDNREIRRSLSRVQSILLESQRELAFAKEEQETWWTIRREWDAVSDWASQTWDSYLAVPAQTCWKAYGKEPWEAYGLHQWKRAQFLYEKFRVHGRLVLNLAADLVTMSMSEIVLVGRNAPETAPYLLQYLWEASKPLRTTTSQLYEQTSVSLKRMLTTNASAAKTRIDSIWGQMKDELRLEELDPHIRAVRSQMEHIDRAMSPHFDRTNRVWEDLKSEFKSLLKSVKQVASKSLDRIGAMFNQLWLAIGKRRDNFVQEFSLAARTAFLLMKVYQAPKMALDIAEFCHKFPETALRRALEYFTVFLACVWLVKRVMFPGKHKRLSQRKVQFAITQ